jgi:hypothetical protein
MNKTVLIAISALLFGCPSDDEGGDDTVGMTMGMTMSSSSAGSTGDTTMPDSSDSSDSEEESDTAAECPDDSLSHAADIQPIWEEHCVEGCHEPGGLWPSNDLTDGYEGLVDQSGIAPLSSENDDLQLVTPGSVENSFVVDKMRGTHVEAIGGDDAELFAGLSMPVEENPAFDPKKNDEPQFLESGPIPEDQIQLVEDWINCGAPE